MVVQAYADYIEMLELTEDMIRAAATAATGSTKVPSSSPVIVDCEHIALSFNQPNVSCSF